MRNVKMASHLFKSGIVAGSIPALIANDMYMRKSLSFDMDAIMGLTKEQLEGYLRVNEQEIIELLDLNKELLRRVKDLERDIEYYKGHIKDLESIKVEAKASKSVWRTIAALCGAVGAFIASLFFRRED